MNEPHFFHINERNCLISRLFSSSTPICTYYIHIHFDKCTFLECLTTTYLSYQKRINLTFCSTQKIQNYVVEHNLTNIHIFYFYSNYFSLLYFFFLLLCFRLPFPWLLYTLVNGVPVDVDSSGVGCSISMLFAMLLLVFLSILSFKWKMTKGMGIIMGFFYFIFVIVSLGFSYCWYICPIGK